MESYDYSFVFGDIRERRTLVRVFDHESGEEKEVLLAVRDNQILRSGRVMLPIVADMIDVCGAVYTADRLSAPSRDMQRRIAVTLSLRNPDLWDETGLRTCLEDTLHDYTSDHWSFFFKKRTEHRRPAELQIGIPWQDRQGTMEVALWSGGLDSAAGFYHRLLSSPHQNFMLAGTGGNSYISAVQHKVALSVEQHIREKYGKRTTLVRIPIEIYNSKELRKNRDMRSRGFIFVLLGSACAYMIGQSTLHVYENGIGAMNLPFLSSSVGLDHSRAVHPSSLAQMSTLVSRILGTPFAIRNPFLFYTKGELCAALVRAEATRIIERTVTCDRRVRQKGELIQCGCCSSCLLRRQALASQKIDDETEYLMPNLAFSNPTNDQHDPIHLRAMRRQVSDLRSDLDAADAWQRISTRYLQLHEIVADIAAYEVMDRYVVIEQLLDLYKRYVAEWDRLSYIAGRSVLIENFAESAYQLALPL